MTALVTIEDVDAALKLDLPLGDSPQLDPRLADIEQKMQEATDIVLDYMKRDAGDWTAQTVPGNVSAAIKLVIASLFDDMARGEMLSGLAGGDFKNPVVGLLYRMRDPALA